MSDTTPNSPGGTTPAAPKPVTAAPATPAVKPVPPSPAAKAPAKPAAKGDGLRGFILGFLASPFVLAWTTFTASMTLMTLGTVRFLFPNVLSEPPSKFKAGFPDTYEDGKVVERYKDQ